MLDYYLRYICFPTMKTMFKKVKKKKVRVLYMFILSPCMLLHSLFITNSCTY